MQWVAQLDNRGLCLDPIDHCDDIGSLPWLLQGTNHCVGVVVIGYREGTIPIGHHLYLQLWQAKYLKNEIQWN